MCSFIDGQPAPREPVRHRCAADLVSAIRAAAQEAPDVTGPYQLRTLTYGAYEPGPGRDRGAWVHGAGYAFDAEEWHGPIAPQPTFERIAFRYIDAHGTRGMLECNRARPALLALADKIAKRAGAFEGKTKRAAKPARVASSAPHVVARDMIGADPAGALAIAETAGPVFFGANGARGILYMQCEHVERVGHAWVVGRMVQSGSFRVLHAGTGLAIGDPFRSASLALDYVDRATAEEGFTDRLAVALKTRSALDQTEARAAFVADPDEQPTQAQESGPGAPIAPAPIPEAAEPAETPLSPALAATTGYAWASEAWRRVYWAHVETARVARGLHAVSGEPLAFNGLRLRGDRRPIVAQALRDRTARMVRATRRATRALSAVPAAHASPPTVLSEPIATPYRAIDAVRYVEPAEFAETVAQMRVRCAASTLARMTIAFAHDGARSDAIERGRTGDIGAGPVLLAHLRRIAEHGRTIDSRNDAAEEAQALADALAEHAAHASPPTTQSQATPYGAFQTASAGADIGLSRCLPNADRLPVLVTNAIERIHAGESLLSACAWEWQKADYSKRERVDAWLVRNGHSLRNLQGLAETRFRCLVDMEVWSAPNPAPRTVQPAPEAPPPTVQSDDAHAEWDQAQAEADAMQARAESLASGAEFKECGGSVRFTKASDAQRFAVCGPDMSEPGAYRFTYFDDAGPIGHMGFRTLAGACVEALALGYEPVEMLADPPAEVFIDMASLPPATQSQAPAGPFRISAMRADYAPENRPVHVLFSANRDRTGPCVGFYMSRQTYRAIPLDAEATPADYERSGPLQPAPADFVWSADGKRAEAARHGCPTAGPLPPTVQSDAPRDVAPPTAHSEARRFRMRSLPRIPAFPMDPRARIPARFAPVYLLRSGVQS